VPVSKHPGDEVIAGSINRSGSVRFRSTAVGSDTTLAQIVDLVQQAQNSKAPGQRLADRAAEYLVILAVGSGIVTFLAWYFLGGAAAITAMTFAISAVVSPARMPWAWRPRPPWQSGPASELGTTS
jgi:P-type Cu2+ transporter